MLHRRLALVVTLGLLIAALRLAYTATVCECGWGFLLTQWQDASLGLVGLGHTPIGRLAPSKQAHFWLNEVDRIVGDDPSAASLHMGAAWLLDSPDSGFLVDHMRTNTWAKTIPTVGLELDETAVADAKAKYRDQCLDRCLELAESATQKDTSDRRWWRMRAMLLFEGDTFCSGKEFRPRKKDWLAILDECKKYDPDNALYDYLAALQLWNASASYDWSAGSADTSAGSTSFRAGPESTAKISGEERLITDNESYILTVHAPDQFALGLQRFLTAQKLPYLAIGEAGYPAIVDFLANSGLRKLEQAEAAQSRLLTFRHATLLYSMWRWQDVRADEARRVHDRQAEIAIPCQCLRFFDQAVSPAETAALETHITFSPLRRRAYEAILKLHEADPTTMAQDHLQAIERREEELRITAATLEQALKSFADLTYSQNSAVSWSTIVSAVACTSVAFLLVLSGILRVMGKLLYQGADLDRQLGILPHLVAWTVGYGSTFIVLGMAPAEMISHEVQRVAILAGLWIVIAGTAALAAALAVKFMRIRKYRYRLTTLFAGMTVVAVFAALWPTMTVLLAEVKQTPELWLHAKGWNGVDAEVLLNAQNLSKSTWYWAMIQWYAHAGQYVGLGVAVCLAVAWRAVRSAREWRQQKLGFTTQPIRSWWSQLLCFAAHSALGAAICWLSLYLCIAPKAVQLAEAGFQHRMRYFRNPEAHWTEIIDAQAAVAASVAEMAQIREHVQFEMSGKEVLEKDFSPK